MKKIIRSLTFLLGLMILFSCSEDSRFMGDDMSGPAYKNGNAKEVTVTVPFDARFTGEYLWMGPHPDHPECGEWDPANGQFWVLVINAGEGTSTLLGNFTYQLEFCANAATGEYPGEYASGYFEAANGDRLFIMSAGQVIIGREEDHPEHVIDYWRDPWLITGGTGRFEGATGEGMTDDYDSSLDTYSHHHWTGTITLIKGKDHPHH